MCVFCGVFIVYNTTDYKTHKHTEHHANYTAEMTERQTDRERDGQTEMFLMSPHEV